MPFNANAFASSFYPGFQKGELTQAEIDAAQLRNREAKASLDASLANIFGTGADPYGLGGATPTAAATTNQPPMAATPDMGSSAVAPGPMPPQGAGAGGPLPAGAPPMAPPAGGAPAPSPAPSVGPQGMTDPAQMIRAMFGRMRTDPRNQGIPDTVLMGQAIKVAQAMSPYDRALLQYALGQQRVDATLRGQDIGLQKTNIQQAGAWDRAQLMSGDRRAIAQMVDATRNKIAGGGALTPEDIDNLATARSFGDTSVTSLGFGSGPIRAQILSRAAQKAKERGTTLQQADIDYAAGKTGANTVARTGANVAIGAAELKPLAPLIMDAARKVNPTQFPTVNAVVNAVRRGTGDPNIVQLNSYIQTMRNAYSQIASRGGRITDQVRRAGDELINGNMPISQLAAAAEAMAKEGEVVRGATGQAMQDVTGRATGGAPAPGGIIQYDAQGNRVQ